MNNGGKGQAFHLKKKNSVNPLDSSQAGKQSVAKKGPDML